MSIRRTSFALHVIAFLLLCDLVSNGQSLSPERVKMIKAATVKVTIKDVDKMGTGFFIDNKGTVATCWHVIEPAFIKNGDNKITGIRKIFIERNPGELIQYDIPISFIQNEKINQDAVAFDFCVLMPVNPSLSFLISKTPFLKLGNFDNLNEGDEIYTCGYPIGIEQKFISKGIVSTKYIDTNRYVITNGQKILKPRSEVLLDITLNKGNSGGPVIKIGKTIEDDVVIAMSDFIITPTSAIAEELITYLTKNSGSVIIQNVDQNAVFSFLAQIVSGLSIGVSGAVSINHFWTSLGIPVK